MHEKKYEDAKKEIRSVLLTYQGNVVLEEFLRTYKDLLGERLPSRTLGFSTDVAFLQSMPDVVNVSSDARGKVHLTGVADEKSEHIQKLVNKQRKPNTKSKNKPNRNGNNYRLPDTSYNVRDLKPFLPGALKAEILQLTAKYPYGITFTAFSLAYRREFKKYLPLTKGWDTLEGMIKLIPELEIKLEGNEKKICHRSSQWNNEYLPRDDKKENMPVSQLTEKDDRSNSINVHESGISDDILKNFELMIKNCPEGILDIHFSPLYENIFKKPFDLHELGYNSLLDLVDALPHVFQRILNPEDNKSWLILPRKLSIKHHLKDGNDSCTSSRRQSHLSSQEGIPADVASPVLQFIEPRMPEQIDFTEYIPVFISAIVDPSRFWFQLQTDEASQSFDMLENDIGKFYNTYAEDAYRMKDSDIVIGATCVIQCPRDKQWYRAVIQAIPNMKFVNVSYVDYGSTENIPRNNLYYVRSKYHEYAACAFKAKLADLKPSNATVWSSQAQRRFIELCDSAVLMAYLKDLEKDTYSVKLCDTNDPETDIFLSETLINEGFAELCQDQFCVTSIDSPHNISEESAFCNSLTTDSDGEFSSGSNPSNLQTVKNNLSSGSKVLPVSKALLSSPKRYNNEISSNISPLGKMQENKRHVKLLELCEDTKLHFINLENKLYMSCGDLARLLWNDMDSEFLAERLKYKEINVPLLKLSKENHPDLFQQCIWYKISEFEKLEPANSLLIICSLEWAFNVLNIFGHPSVCLRLAIQNELKSFDPSDPFWKEFCYQKSHDLNEEEEDFNQKISKLCLYDLKTKNEALKITRLKLLRGKNDGAKSEEIRRIESFQNVIEERIKEIDAVCSMFSSCS